MAFTLEQSEGYKELMKDDVSKVVIMWVRTGKEGVPQLRTHTYTHTHARMHGINKHRKSLSCEKASVMSGPLFTLQNTKWNK